MLLAIDIGNTNITLGVFDDRELLGKFRMTTMMSRTSDEYGITLRELLRNQNMNPDEIDAVIVASVVPDIMHSFSSAIIKYFGHKPVIVSAGIKTGIRVATENPRQTGPDRIVDAVAAYKLYGGPIIVVDFGTATTFDLVEPDGTFGIGGFAICCIANYDFAPTPLSEKNLKEENVHGEIFVTGNTVIDALHMVVEKLKTDGSLRAEQDKVLFEAGYDVTRLADGKKLVLITGHRRENFGDGFIRMVSAMKDISEKYPEVDFVYPMHLNPNVRKPIHEVFGEDLTRPNFFFIEPLQYLEFVHLMNKANIVLTDSGGIQEEAPSLGKPVLVMRDTTERPEALASGTVYLVGTDYDKIVSKISTLLDDASAYEKMSKAVNPYGDGKACSRIIAALNGENPAPYGK